MAIPVILSFFVVLIGAAFVLGGFASGAIGFLALLAGLGVASVGVVGLFQLIKHDEFPDTFQPKTHDPHAR